MIRAILFCMFFVLPSLARADLIDALKGLNGLLQEANNALQPGQNMPSPQAYRSNEEWEGPTQTIDIDQFRVTAGPSKLGILMKVEVKQRGTIYFGIRGSLYLVQGTRRSSFHWVAPQGEFSTYRSSTTRCAAYADSCRLDNSQPELISLTNLPDWFDKNQPYKLISYSNESPFEIRFNEEVNNGATAKPTEPFLMAAKDVKARVGYELVGGGANLLELVVTPETDGVPFSFNSMLIVQGERDGKLAGQNHEMRWTSTKQECMYSCRLYGPVRFKMQVSPPWLDIGKPFKIVREGGVGINNIQQGFSWIVDPAQAISRK